MAKLRWTGQYKRQYSICYAIPYLVTPSSLFPLAVLIFPLVVLVYSLVALIYQLVVLVSSFICQIVVLVSSFIFLLVVLVCPHVVSVCPLVALPWSFVCQLIVLVVLSVGPFITDCELSLFVILFKVTYTLFYHKWLQQHNR